MPKRVARTAEFAVRGSCLPWPSINWTGADVFFARIAGMRLYLGGSSSYLTHADAIGSTTMIIDNTEALVNDPNYYPWGQGWHQTGGGTSFADLGNAVNDPLYPSASREYNDGLGRWNTPDPGGVKVVKLTNPQTWNMYEYAGDNPTTLNDPSGLATGCTNQSTGCVAQNTTTVTYETGTTTRNSSGDVVVTTTTVRANFAKATNKFISATSETTSKTLSANGQNGVTVSNRTDMGPHGMTPAQFTKFLNSQAVAVDPGPVVWYARTQVHDIAAHPNDYLFKAGEFGFAVTPLPEALGAYEGVKAMVDLYGAGADLLYSLNH